MSSKRKDIPRTEAKTSKTCPKEHTLHQLLIYQITQLYVKKKIRAVCRYESELRKNISIRGIFSLDASSALFLSRFWGQGWA
jgi:hypothetical protein